MTRRYWINLKKLCGLKPDEPMFFTSTRDALWTILTVVALILLIAHMFGLA